jgi:hypothetical protein
VFLWIAPLVLFVLFSLNKSKIIGSIGEAYVRKQINTLNPEVYKSVHDLYVPTKIRSNGHRSFIKGKKSLIIPFGRITDILRL